VKWRLEYHQEGQACTSSHTRPHVRACRDYYPIWDRDASLDRDYRSARNEIERHNSGRVSSCRDVWTHVHTLDYRKPIESSATARKLQHSPSVRQTILQEYIQSTRCSLCRLIRVLSTWCRAAAFFSASGAALSQEVPTVKWMPSEPALWTPDIMLVKNFCKLKLWSDPT
jgi:hypothetical protein